MLDLDLGFGQVNIHLCYLKGGVSQDQAQGHDVAPVHQIPHGEGVPEEMRMQPRHLGSLSKTLDDLPEALIG